MPGASLILRVICLGVLTSEAALNGPVRPEKLSRRALLAGTLAMPLLVAVPQKGSASEDGPQDPRTTWSFFGLVAPPIQATWSYDTLVEPHTSNPNPNPNLNPNPNPSRNPNPSPSPDPSPNPSPNP